MLKSSNQQLAKEVCGLWHQHYLIFGEKIGIYSNTDLDGDLRIDGDICLCKGFLRQV